MWHILRKTIVLRTTGAVLICASVLVTGFWFLWLVPVTRRSDPLWEEQFTRKAYWSELQKQIRRYGWMHDDFGPVGLYGDEVWVNWIMSKAEAGEKIANCGNIGHKDQALKHITCNDPAGRTNWNMEAQWLGWWSTNKNKSQVDWIRAGLEAHGVSVQLPPSEADHEALLALLGNRSTNSAEMIPQFVKYNVFRWLRDSGFDAIPFAISNVTAQTPPLVREGLLEYGKYERTWPREEAVGLLSFAPAPPDLADGYRIAFYEPAIQIIGYSLMTVPMILGAALLIYSFRKRTTVQEGVSPPGQA
jgi:hypothetical protein